MNMFSIRKNFAALLFSLIKNLNMSLRKKVLFLYGCIVVVPIMILGLVAGQLVIQSLRTDYRNSVIEAVQQAAENVEFRKKIYELLVNRIATDGELIARLSEDFSDFDSQYETVHYIDRAYGTIPESQPGIVTFRIYHNNPTLVEDGGIVWKPNGRKLAHRNEDEWYESMVSKQAPMLWEAVPEENYQMLDMTLSRRITYSYNENMGVVFLRLRTDEVFGTVISKPFYGQGDIYLVQGNGYIFASSDKSLTGEYISNTELSGVPFESGIQFTTDEIGKVNKFIVSVSISSGWHIVSTLPLASLEKQTRTTFIWITVITLSLILLSALLILAVMDNLVQRLHGLEHNMRAVTKGKFDVSVERKNADELGDLEKGFNIMVGRLGELVDEIAVSRSREREEILKALQAQINPHFLYNTLSIIRWRALDAGDQELCQLVDSMTTFYRLSLNKGNSILRIRDELEHVKAYIQIQQLRYPKAVTVEWDVDQSLMDFYTIKLILQPVVENSYIHSMIAKNKNGILTISVKRSEDCILFEICDNGVGMPPEVVQNILSGQNTSRNNGYGIYNIKERLNLYFGNAGKLHVDSVEGKGTAVTIAIPVCTEQPRLNGYQLK